MTWVPLVLAALVVAVATGNPYVLALVPFLTIVFTLTSSILTQKEGPTDD